MNIVFSIIFLLLTITALLLLLSASLSDGALSDCRTSIENDRKVRRKDASGKGALTNKF
jgi:hypothetical protein